MSRKIQAVMVDHEGGVRIEALSLDAIMGMIEATSAAISDSLQGMGADGDDGAMRDAMRAVVAGTIVAARSAGLNAADIERSILEGTRLGIEAIPLPKGGDA